MKRIFGEPTGRMVGSGILIFHTVFWAFHRTKEILYWELWLEDKGRRSAWDFSQAGVIVGREGPGHCGP